MPPAVRLITRLAWRNVRHRPWQAALLLFALCLSTSTLTLALAVNESGTAPWDRLHEATNGFHVDAFVTPRRDAAPTDEDVARARQQLADLRNAPGVVAASGPWRLLYATGEVAGKPTELRVQVRDASPAAVGQPLLTSGSWLDAEDTVVLEDGLASTLHVKPGDTVAIAGRSLTVRGTAMTVNVFPYPIDPPGTVWITTSTAQRLDPAAVAGETEFVELRLSSPQDAETFVAAHSGSITDDQFRADMHAWQMYRNASNGKLEFVSIALGFTGTMLAGLTIATAAVLVAGRMAAQIRQVGTLKAVGVTPGQLTWIQLIEYLALAATAAIVGLTAGALIFPLLARPLRVAYGAPEAAPITLNRAAIVAGVAVFVVVLGTVRPALRGARHSTLRSLVANVHQPPARRDYRASRLARLTGSLRLPLPAVLGIRAALRRPGRTVANAAGLTLGIAMVIIGLALNGKTADFRLTAAQEEAYPGEAAELTGLLDQFRMILFAGAALLLALAAVNAAVAAIFAAHESARNQAILRALGATPRQTVIAFAVAQLSACLLACALGIPLGLALFNSVAGDLGSAQLSARTYAAVAAVALLLYAVAVAAPARLLAKRPVTPLLAYE